MFFGGRNKPCALQKKRMNFTGRAHGHKTWTVQASVVGEDVVLLLVVDLGVVVVRVGRLLLLVGRIEVDDLEKKTNTRNRRSNHKFRTPRLGCRLLTAVTPPETLLWSVCGCAA